MSPNLKDGKEAAIGTGRGRTVPREGSRNCTCKGPEAGAGVCMFIKRKKIQCSNSRVAIWEEWHHAGPPGSVKEFRFYSSCERSHWMDGRTRFLTMRCPVSCHVYLRWSKTWSCQNGWRMQPCVIVLFETKPIHGPVFLCCSYMKYNCVLGSGRWKGSKST